MSSTMLSAQARNFNWLLSSFQTGTEGVDHAFAVSSDGLLIALSTSLTRDEADKMAAVVTGLQSLSEGARVLLNHSRLKRVILDLEDGYLLISTISDAATLGVAASYDCDLGYVGYEMTLFAEKVGDQLTPEILTELRHAVQE
ncbi:MAG: roadblock/LC7 domain-containing protein [Acidimicrobiales bacterium]